MPAPVGVGTLNENTRLYRMRTDETRQVRRGTVPLLVLSTVIYDVAIQVEDCIVKCNYINDEQKDMIA